MDHQQISSNSLLYSLQTTTKEASSSSPSNTTTSTQVSGDSLANTKPPCFSSTSMTQATQSVGYVHNIYNPSRRPQYQDRSSQRLPPALSRSSTSSISSASSPSPSATSGCTERDLFPQPAQFDIRIPMLPDPAPLADTPMSPITDTPQARTGSPISPRQNISHKASPPPRSPSPSNRGQLHHHSQRYKQHLFKRPASPSPSYHNHEQPPVLARPEQVGVPAITTDILPDTVEITALDNSLPVRVQFREELLLGGDDCIDDDDLFEVDDEYDADDDEISDSAFDEEQPYYRAGSSVSTPLPTPQSMPPPRDLFPPMDLTFAKG
ncbi:hypothetical protein V1512DRAFT_247377 [Lipomyces arxii]|uniref:uncharacterized protein n=1 Tax=Lipomyces arxii TaxID=56418 RepID=UPI0034CFB577